ncbi:3-hydroxyacyl-CoA dehydrogenase NAD-binding domain-containing protein [Bacillus sp. FJAT-44742]|uniref:3-hydroxyacyl-CoA dehydrogenase NAD-binding domain-containing protein n=1 Tax=Bacillus sp. FJAT-44742 TaxID=2014005 RepID=UPI000C23E5BE|nr:3-hydroxyacyl-CoA dehydrogenase NAD-binding domain-containing protein [Bacillus sp. FJAT-44742]
MEKINNVAVIGSGTMGAGIAQVAVQHGFTTVLYDIEEDQVKQAKHSIFKRLDRLVEKGKISEDQRDSAKNLLFLTTNIEEVGQVDLVIEAAPEKIEIKHSIFEKLEAVCSSTAVLASNTSSLSITEISGRRDHPNRVAGLHFFNPAPLMPLVEVIKGMHTSEEVIETLRAFAVQLNKTPVFCKDTPGFIVNRVARPFYNEALRMAQDQVASVEQIDKIMRNIGGFKMGPFELQDLIGIDINYATTTTVYDSFSGESRFRPSSLQKRMVQGGRLGRKTEGGFYEYKPM